MIFAKIWYWLFGRRCENCGGIGLDIIYNGWTTECPVCHGKGRVR